MNNINYSIGIDAFLSITGVHLCPKTYYRQIPYIDVC